MLISFIYYLRCLYYQLERQRGEHHFIDSDIYD